MNSIKLQMTLEINYNGENENAYLYKIKSIFDFKEHHLYLKSSHDV